ncbi:MAG TPA: response regulator [Thermoanaerobaculia bacterium]|nr:response regulator [Thermoanaerobaculia bacterium]
MSPSSEDPAIKILIVDDTISNVRLLEHTLRRGGYTGVSSTSDPREVASLHRDNAYDLILLDLQMPWMNGFDVMKQLREAGGKPRVAILIISADPAMMVAALEAGADSFLSKPFLLSEVLARVGALLEARARSGNEKRTASLAQR